MIKYKPGDWLFIWTIMKFVKVNTVRRSGDLITLWVQDGDTEYPISALDWSNIFVIKCTKYPIKTNESKVTKATDMIKSIGIFCAIAIAIYFMS